MINIALGTDIQPYLFFDGSFDAEPFHSRVPFPLVGVYLQVALWIWPNLSLTVIL